MSLETVEDSLKSGLEKSYSEVPEPTSNSVMPTEAIKTVAKQVIVEEELRKNIMVFGIHEADNEDTQTAVRNAFEELEEKPRLYQAVRLGKKMHAKARPVKVTLSSASIVQQILSKSRKLRQTANYKTVFLAPDRTLDERAKHRELVLQLKEKIVSDPNRKHFLKGGEVISVKLKTDKVTA